MNQYIEQYMKKHQIEKTNIIHTNDKGDMLGMPAPDMRNIAKELAKNPQCAWTSFRRNFCYGK